MKFNFNLVIMANFSEKEVNVVNEDLKKGFKECGKQFCRTIGKAALLAGGAYILYRFGKAVGHAERDVKLEDTLTDIARSEYGEDEHIFVKASDGSEIELEDALEGTKAEDIAKEFISPADVLRIATRNAH